MKQTVIAILDTKTGLYENAHPWIHPVEAGRAWKTILQDASTKYAKNPEDYQMYEIATFDFQTGKYENLPIHIAVV